jgi:hypothetical protein
LLFSDPVSASELEPVAPRERLLTLDVLRGIALFGVLYANLTWIYCLRIDEPVATDSLADILALRFLIVMVTSKAQTLLVLLFGLGFANQLLRADARSEPVLPRHGSSSAQRLRSLRVRCRVSLRSTTRCTGRCSRIRPTNTSRPSGPPHARPTVRAHAGDA